MNIRKLTVLSLLTAIALMIFIIEAQLPPIAPIPGIKMGLANVITLVTMVWFGRREAFVVLILRIVLGSVFAGLLVSFAYSLAGGILCFIVMAILINVFKPQHIWVVSVFGALAHNVGQVISAVVITSTWQIIGYMPLLAVSAVITGAFTGFITVFVINRIRPFIGIEKR